MTGGRPMERIEYAFMCEVSRKPVYYYQDKFGRDWMAQSSWALHRVKLRDD